MIQSNIGIRPLRRDNPAELTLVAERMRTTLIEVMGQARGASMYTLSWLRDRVDFHLDPSRCLGQGLLAEKDGEILGHSLMRVQENARGHISTIFVVPAARRQGIARALLVASEGWLCNQKVRSLSYDTAIDHVKIHALFHSAGYNITDVDRSRGMVRLSRTRQ